VRHVETEQLPDLGDAGGMVADTEGAMVCWSKIAPAVDELRRRQGEGDARGRVADAQRRAGHTAMSSICSPPEALTL
jgi:hypothetical protein